MGPRIFLCIVVVTAGTFGTAAAQPIDDQVSKERSPLPSDSSDEAPIGANEPPPAEEIREPSEVENGQDTPPPFVTYPQNRPRPVYSHIGSSADENEVPPAPMNRRQALEAVAAHLMEPKPLGIFGINLNLGIAFGGEKLLTATYSDGSKRSIAAGSGVLVGLGLTLTPLRSESHALGIGVDQSVKLDEVSADNAGMLLTRFPLVGSLRYTYAFSPAWYFVASPGLVYEYGISLSGSGEARDLSTKFNSALGYMVEGGIVRRENSIVIDITLRFTSLHYEVRDMSMNRFNASSGALMIKLGYVF